ncbi:hypothetical protein ACQP1O_42755 (plasmid) [Nocardia sp. CA-151230]|uniref:hypothetical protein n=1 Tax=Nocardia sp. CA-151230 TaxID=3239982 RepID=UPI003D93334A
MASTWPNPAGAYRNAAWSSAGSTGQQIVFDTVDTSYPYTSLSSGTITINRAGRVSVAAQGVISGFSMTITLKVNGATVATGSNGTTSTLSYSYYANNGDQLQIWETDTVASTSGSTGASTTYIHVTPGGTRTQPYNAMVAVNQATLY